MIGFKIIDFIRGTNIVDTYEYLRKIQYLETDELNILSKTSFDGLFSKSKQVTFYKDFNSYDELPILNKSIIKENYDKFQNFNIKNADKVKKKTGGSTGEPFVYLTSKESQSYLWGGVFCCHGMQQVGDTVTLWHF